MILGKAWTSLPSSNPAHRNPTAWLIKQLELLSKRVKIIPQRGCLWVAATDTLLSFFDDFDCDDEVDDEVGRGLREQQKPEESDLMTDAAADDDDDDDDDAYHNEYDPWTVLGVAVPAPVSTAKNHGVYVMKQQQGGGSASIADQEEITIESPVDVWQKPTIEQLTIDNSPTGTGSGSASFDMSSTRGSERQAWVDTGIVIFFPEAFRTLIKLSSPEGLLLRCTWSGLEALYQDACQQNDDSERSTTSLTQEQWAKENALKIDLYTDIMHNLSWSRKTETKTNKNALDAELHQALSKLQLKTLLVPNGIFLHLGTTRELIDFITHGSSNESSPTATTTNHHQSPTTPPPVRAVAKALRLESRSHSHGSISNSSRCPSNVSSTSDDDDDDDDDRDDDEDDAHLRNVVHYSIFPMSPSSLTSSSEPNALSFVGESTFIEYCDFEGYDSVTIGNDCMVSGWRRIRSTTTASTRGSDQDTSVTATTNTTAVSLEIPDSLSVQMLSLKESGRYVYMVLGTDDSIKDPIHDATLYGVDFSKILHRTGISVADLISQSDIAAGKDFLWTAKIHPIVSFTGPELPSFSSLFDWVNLLRNETYEGRIQDEPSFELWSSSERVSLKDLHGRADAWTEWEYRNALEDKSLQIRLEKTILSTEILLRERCQDRSCDDLIWLTDIANRDTAIGHLVRFVKAMNEIAISELRLGNNDISGRSLMLASTVLADFDEAMEMNIGLQQDILGECTKHIQKLKLSSTHFTPAEIRVEIIDQVLLLAEAFAGDEKRPLLLTWSKILEMLALCLVEFTISDGFRQILDQNGDESKLKINFKRTEHPIFDKWVLSSAPVRVDLAGGWSDTPPICYENGGSVTGMALLVDGMFPLLCRCRVVQGGNGITIRSEIRESSNQTLSLSQEARIDDPSHLDDFRSPTSQCALTKACLVGLGIATEEQLQSSNDLQPLVNSFCGTTDNVGIEIVTTSLLGMGSGMGTSSILAACILSSVSKCVGIGSLRHELIIHSVLMVEQLLSSGGGWQDQAHGVLPGIKTVRSQPPQIPLAIQIEQLDVSASQIQSLEKRLVFVFTGKTRLAKNILQQVLRRWSKRTHEIVETVHGLVDASENLRSAALDGDWETVAEYMDKSFGLKCLMAGESSGALPSGVKLFSEELKTRGLIHGAMLCGAGGGGFLLLITTEGIDRRKIEETFRSDMLGLDPDFADFAFHGCSIATQGLVTRILGDEGKDDSLESHSISWHRMD
mmetsp:Transcript_29965/g.72683  ORF Transcript_29965/g.72683 Transcript_29965/m.72683 type:complete len:1243 (+) Transcript_29965:357-4085(+)